MQKRRSRCFGRSVVGSPSRFLLDRDAFGSLMQIQLGCHYRHSQLDDPISVYEKFARVRDTGVFDFLDWLPRPELVDECLRASEATGVPMLTGTWYYALGRDEPLLERDLRNAARCGIKMLNLMIFAQDGAGRAISDAEVAECYLRTYELGMSLGVTPSFEVHVDCWSEEYPRVARVRELVQARGVPFWFTLDYSHVIFKIGNPAELERSGVRDAVERGALVLDPYEPGNLCEQWLASDTVGFAQFRPVVPGNPPNLAAVGADGKPGRGIQYPFVRPAPGEYHAPWSAWKLEACKEAVRSIIRYHLTHASSPLRYMTTEMIASFDYGQGAKYSIWEHNLAAGRWIRATWAQLAAMQAAGIPLEVSTSR